MRLHWKSKAFIQRILSGLPGGQSVYSVLQRRFGGFKDFSVLSKLWQGHELVKALVEAKVSISGKNTLEIGTGWVPIIPLFFYVLGHRSCNSFDISRLLQDDLTLKAAHQIASLLEKTSFIDDKNVAARLAMLRRAVNLPDLLRKTEIYYHSPSDARRTNLPANSIDAIYSNATLEHIPTDDIIALLQEAYRLLIPGGIMVHLVDCSDHFSHADKNICNLNFLLYSERKWRKYNTYFLYQNRLRPSHYREVLRNAGFKILHWQIKMNDKFLESFPANSLPQEFTKLAPEDVSATRVTFVAQRL